MKAHSKHLNINIIFSMKLWANRVNQKKHEFHHLKARRDHFSPDSDKRAKEKYNLAIFHIKNKREYKFKTKPIYNNSKHFLEENKLLLQLFNTFKSQKRLGRFLVCLVNFENTRFERSNSKT